MANPGNNGHDSKSSGYSIGKKAYQPNKSRPYLKLCLWSSMQSWTRRLQFQSPSIVLWKDSLSGVLGTNDGRPVCARVAGTWISQARMVLGYSLKLFCVFSFANSYKLTFSFPPMTSIHELSSFYTRLPFGFSPRLLHKQYCKVLHLPSIENSIGQCR